MKGSYSSYLADVSLTFLNKFPLAIFAPSTIALQRDGDRGSQISELTKIASCLPKTDISTIAVVASSISCISSNKKERWPEKIVDTKCGRSVKNRLKQSIVNFKIFYMSLKILAIYIKKNSSLSMVA
jgi:hypothetical protein